MGRLLILCAAVLACAGIGKTSIWFKGFTFLSSCIFLKNEFYFWISVLGEKKNALVCDIHCCIPAKVSFRLGFFLKKKLATQTGEENSLLKAEIFIKSSAKHTQREEE